MLDRIARKIRREGVVGISSSLLRRVFPPRLAAFDRFKPSIEHKVGLEIGGPSAVFTEAGIVPVYPIVARLDNCTFGQNTVWEGEIVEGDTFCFNESEAPGRQYITEASALAPIAAETYDFLISSHVLEHVANPLAALAEWRRVLKDEGIFVLVLPHKDGTFDHRRPVTSMAHLVADFEQRQDESDLTHLEETLELHDLTRDPGAGDFESFKQRSLNNLHNRCLHHHVFDTQLTVDLVDLAGFDVLTVELFRPFHIIVVATKSKRANVADATGRSSHPRPTVGWRSPFPSDRKTPH